jgi:hypothetical protein
MRLAFAGRSIKGIGRIALEMSSPGPNIFTWRRTCASVPKSTAYGTLSITPEPYVAFTDSGL